MNGAEERQLLLHLGGLAHHLGQIERLHLKVHPACLNARAIEQIVNQPGQPGDLPLAASQLIGDALNARWERIERQVWLGLQLFQPAGGQLGVHLDGRQGSLEFMAGDAHKVIHALVGFAQGQRVPTRRLAFAPQPLALQHQGQQLGHRAG